MGYREAVEDGVRRSGSGANLYYYPPCCVCGEEVPSWGYRRGINYMCQKCKLLDYISDRAQVIDNNRESKERKFQNAVERIYRVAKKKGEYAKAVAVVHEKLHTDGWFASTEEIMAAIELVKRKVRVRHQVKMGPYTVDFVLPDEKVILEIDGSVWHAGEVKKKDELRDNLILLAKGPEWEVIRITDGYINQNVTRLVPAIRTIRQKRQSLRGHNGGVLPEWYNGRL